MQQAQLMSSPSKVEVGFLLVRTLLAVCLQVIGMLSKLVIYVTARLDQLDSNF